MTKLPTFGVLGAVLPVQHALASGEVVVYVMAIDAVLLIAAAIVILFALRGPVFMKAGLLALYIATEVVLYLIPADLLRPAVLNGPFHFALPALICAIAYVTYTKFGVRIRNDAP